jgi:hypothetical protein
MPWRLITNYFIEDGRSKFVGNVGIFQSIRSHILGVSSHQLLISDSGLLGSDVVPLGTRCHGRLLLPAAQL